VPAAEAAARELPHIGLLDALELTLLIARKDPRRHQRVAGRWLLRRFRGVASTSGRVVGSTRAFGSALGLREPLPAKTRLEAGIGVGTA
jgi:hypothetical protein